MCETATSQVAVEFATDNLTEGKRAGIALVQSNEYHLRTEVSRVGAGIAAEVILCQKGQDEVIGRSEIRADEAAGVSIGDVKLVIRVQGLSAAVEMEYDQKENADGKLTKGSSLLKDGIDVRNLSTEVAGGFVGCTVGMYAVADTDSRDQAACFKTLTYQAL